MIGDKTMESRMIALAKGYAGAYLSRDASALERILDDDWTLITAGCGDKVGKRQQLEDLKSGKLIVSSIEDSEVAVRTFGDAAIVSGVRRSTATYNKRDVSDLARFTQIYVAKDGEFRCVSTQITSLANFSVEAQVLRLAVGYRDAYLNSDVASLDRLLDDDWTLVTAGCGDVVRKPGQLEDLKSGKLAVESIEDSGVAVQVYGDVAIVTGLRKSKVSYNKRDVSDLARYTQIYVRKDESWRCVSTQVTGIRPDPDREAGAA